jgi:peptide-methionine (R)-S-oxide reductase
VDNEEESMSDGTRTEEEWRRLLTPEQYHILREKGTEPAFTGEFWDNHESGMYACAGCGAELFSSENKFDSGSGWPSFWTALGNDKIKLEDDRGHGMVRIEVQCANCGGHLGHLFEDGPQPTGQRFCINSACLTFQEEE